MEPLDQPLIFTRGRAGWYVAALIALALGGFFCVQMNRQWHARYGQWQAQEAQRRAAWTQQSTANITAWTQIASLRARRDGSGRPTTRGDAERLLNNGQPFTDAGEVFKYHDPASGGMVWLFFNGEQWTHVGSVEAPQPEVSPRPHHLGYKVADTLRRTACGLAYASAAGLLLMLLWHWRLLSRPRRLRASMDIVFMSAVALVLALLSPYSDRLWTFFFLDPGGWGVIGIMIGSILLARAAVSRPRGAEPTCLACGYDLTGNVSGVCPECGTPVPALVPRHSQESTSGV